MKYDRKIKSLIRDIKFSCDCYLEDVTDFNECASTDRIVEKIIETAKELKKYHEKRFEIFEKKPKEKDR